VRAPGIHRAQAPALRVPLADGTLVPTTDGNPLEQVPEGYRAMDERRAIKALLRP
jgi:hypothetical protein